MHFAKMLCYAWMMSVSPQAPDPPEKPPVQLHGEGTYYGTEHDTQFYGSHMANGEPFRPNKRATIATKSVPLGELVLVETPGTGKAMWLRNTDRGPYVVEAADGSVKPVDATYTPKPGEEWIRVADLSVLAAKKLGVYNGGMYEVRVRYAKERSGTRVAWKSESE